VSLSAFAVVDQEHLVGGVLAEAEPNEPWTDLLAAVQIVARELPMPQNVEYGALVVTLAEADSSEERLTCFAFNSRETVVLMREIVLTVDGEYQVPEACAKGDLVVTNTHDLHYWPETLRPFLEAHRLFRFQEAADA
jgi:hypothetical protein